MAQSAAVKADLSVYGVVQGVGFRPFVARLAREYALWGWVRNVQGQVEIQAIGQAKALACFVHDLTAKKPPASLIRHVEMSISPLSSQEPSPKGFAIIPSQKGESGLPMPSPDLAVCDDCLREMDTPSDPRYGNPFISCTHCGPRFSIMERLPYDRPHTAMRQFPLCPLCARAYQDPADRRYHAQTVCCNDCGPTLCYHSRERAVAGKEALAAAVATLNAGEIIGVKGIGGYHLAASAFLPETVATLRRLKGRDHKPFAVMFETLGEIETHCQVSEEESKLLSSPARPIVLLRRRPSAITPGVYGTSPELGAFLPYTPLQVLLLRQTGPLIMTSANPSSLPILKDDEEALDFFRNNPALSGLLTHDRAITRRLDDSVAAVIEGVPTLLRRARGYAPLPLALPGDGPPLLACGGQEKSVFCLVQNGYAYLSPEIGDLDTRETEQAYRDAVSDMEALLRITPEHVVCDLHPGYVSTRYGEERIGKLERRSPKESQRRSSKESQRRSPKELERRSSKESERRSPKELERRSLRSPPHHFAHICSVMAEHGLREPVIGVAFDGTGYGLDGTSWGGEFLIARPDGFTRAGHLKPALLLGGDASVRQGWKSAACLLWGAGLSFAEDSRTSLVEAALKTGVNCYPSSSMGRVFDGVSAMLGICQDSHYGGQCAIELEYAATHSLLSGGNQQASPFPYDLLHEDEKLIVDLAPCLSALYTLHRERPAPQALAFRFHVTIAHMIAEVCTRLSQQTGLKAVALSGGVFANRLLLGQTLPLLAQAGLRVYRNHQVPPGDGGLALGQAYAARHMSSSNQHATEPT